MNDKPSPNRCQGCRRIIPAGTAVWAESRRIVVLHLDGTKYEGEIWVWKCDDCTMDAMPGDKKPGPSIKKPKVYEALRDEGMSKEKAAKISNAQAKKGKKK